MELYHPHAFTVTCCSFLEPDLLLGSLAAYKECLAHAIMPGVSLGVAHTYRVDMRCATDKADKQDYADDGRQADTQHPWQKRACHLLYSCLWLCSQIRGITKTTPALMHCPREQ